MPTTIRIITAPHEREAVYRQRYSVYVEELGYPQRHADPETRTVREPLDDTGEILGAFDEAGRLMASLRNNYGNTHFGEYVEYYQMRRFGPYFPGDLAIITKLIIDRPYRRSTVLQRLMCANYLQILGRASFALIDSKPPLDAYFRRYGFRQIAPEFIHPAAGRVVPLVVAVMDHRYFLEVRAPHAKLAPCGPEDPSVSWFRETFRDDLVQFGSVMTPAEAAAKGVAKELSL